MPTPKEENQKRQIAFLADRLSVLIVLIGQREGGWDWLYGEHMWQNSDGIAEVLREWTDYDTAKDIVRLWLKKHNARERDNERPD